MLSIRQLLFAAAAIAIFAAGCRVTSIYWQHRSDQLLEEQKSLLVGQCNDQKKITEETAGKFAERVHRRHGDMGVVFAAVTLVAVGVITSLMCRAMCEERSR